MEPDIVIADYNLPGGLTGLQTIAELRRALHREIPAIILTGDISTGTLRKIAQERCVASQQAGQRRRADASGQDVARCTTPAAAETGTSRRRKLHASKLPSAKSLPNNGDPSLPTVFVIDDDAALRATMVELLALDGRAVETYSSCEAFLETYRPSRKGCLVVDAQMQGMGGLALSGAVKSRGNRAPGHHDHRLWRRVDGRQSDESRRRGFHREAGRARRIDREHRAARSSRTQDSGRPFRSARGRREMHRGPDAAGTSVMDLVLAGHPSKNIAADLGISQRTVENHRASIMKKTGSKSIPALIRTALAAI